MKKLVVVVLILLMFTALLPNLAIPQTVSAADTSVKVTFSIIPTKLISEQSDVELRAGIANSSSSSKQVTIEFKVDGNVVSTASETVSGNNYKISKYWWDTKGKAGCHVLSITAKTDGVTIAEDSRIITVLSLTTPGPKIATIMWEEPGSYSAMTKQDVVNQVNDMYALGVDTIVFCYSEFILYNSGAYYNSDLPELLNVLVPHPVSFDALDTVLKAAEDNGMNVLVGTGRGKDLFTPIPSNSNYDAAVSLCVKVMDEIWNKYGHYKSFYGWYMSHEPSNLFDTGNGELIFFNDVISRVRNKWPDKIVMISPSGTPLMKEDSMRNTQVDVFAFQDAVGPGYIPGQYTYDPEQRIAMLDSIFSTYKAMVDKIGKHIWSNTETWEMAGPTYANPYPAAWSRVERQLDIETKYVETHSFYAYTGFLSSPSSAVKLGGDRAVSLYNAYKSFADSYKSSNGIHEHSLVGLNTVTYKVKTVENVVSSLPKTINAKLSTCLTNITVPVTWETPTVSGSTATVNGSIVMPGVKSARISASITIDPNYEASSSSSTVSSSGTVSSSSTAPSNSSVVSSNGGAASSNNANAQTGDNSMDMVIFLLALVTISASVAFVILKKATNK
jgi:hypothetical protein